MGMAAAVEGKEGGAVGGGTHEVDGQGSVVEEGGWRGELAEQGKDKGGGERT
jgi:hypothetical protein